MFNRKTLGILITVLTTMVMTACNSTTSSVTVDTLQAKVLDQQIVSGEITDIVITPQFNESELEALIGAVDYYSHFRGKWSNSAMLTSNPAAVDTFIADYVQLKQHYNVVRGIVGRHRSEYDPMTLNTLTMFAQRATRVNMSIENALQHRQTMEAVNSALVLGGLLVQTISK